MTMKPLSGISAVLAVSYWWEGSKIYPIVRDLVGTGFLRECVGPTISKRQCTRFYIYKSQKKPNNFIYKKPDTLQKSRQFPLRFYIQNKDTLRYTIFHEIFEVGIYIQKAWQFALREVLIYKKPDTSQKSR